MTATIAKIFIILTLGFEILTAVSGSAYYTAYAYASAAVLISAIIVNVIRKMSHDNMYKRAYASH